MERVSTQYIFTGVMRVFVWCIEHLVYMVSRGLSRGLTMSVYVSFSNYMFDHISTNQGVAARAVTMYFCIVICVKTPLSSMRL